jgi:hypothetical protein
VATAAVYQLNCAIHLSFKEFALQLFEHQGPATVDGSRLNKLN